MSSNALVKATYLADDAAKDQFYREVLKPAGIEIRPDNLFWAEANRRLYPSVDISRPGSAWTFNSKGQLVENAPDRALLDYDPATGKFLGALAEPQRTNFVTSSEDLSTGTLSPTANMGRSAAGFFGELAVTKLTPTTDYGFHFIGGMGPINNVSERAHYSLFAKSNGYRYIYISCARDTDNFGSRTVIFDLETGAFNELRFSVTDAKAQKLQDGWWRISFRNAETSSVFRHFAVGVSESFNASGLEFAGDGVSSVLVTGAQAEDSDAAFPTSYIRTDGSAVIRPATTQTLPQVGDRRRGFIAWQGVMRFDPDASGVTSNQIRQFPFGRSPTSQTINIFSEVRLRARNTTNTDTLTIPDVSESLQGRRVRVVYFWDADQNILGASCDGLSGTTSSFPVGAPPDDPVRFGQTGNNLEGASHTEWAFISYNIPSIEAIEAFTGELAP